MTNDATPSDLVAIAAMERNIVAIFGALAHTLPGAESYHGSELSWTVTRVPFAVFNGIFAARLDAEAADAAIAAAKRRAVHNAVPILWSVAPGNAPPDLARRLKNAGFAYASTMPGMSLDLAQLQARPPDAAGSDVSIALVCDPATARTWCEVFAGGFGFPKSIGDDFLPLTLESAANPEGALCNYLLSAGGEPVATGTTMLTRDVAGLYNVATLAHARRKGFGAALTAHALRDARRRGASTAVLQASELGLGVYERLGFRERGDFQQFIWSP